VRVASRLHEDFGDASLNDSLKFYLLFASRFSFSGRALEKIRRRFCNYFLRANGEEKSGTVEKRTPYSIQCPEKDLFHLLQRTWVTQPAVSSPSRTTVSSTSAHNVPLTSLFLQRNLSDVRNVVTEFFTRRERREWSSLKLVERCEHGIGRTPYPIFCHHFLIHDVAMRILKKKSNVRPPETFCLLSAPGHFMYTSI
jgi:hypothetical protein